ncbi:DUF423 domain-containing protein [Gallaecimonas sp. GXIMD4217]|uniref:DUF423 domain-containing protein n=1 Tax=Gallaecimonas sp. GXIMD4217 TaxID=3131927 RepID=UPI00311B1C17
MKWVLVLASLYGASGVAMGAFAAHGLKQVLSPQLLTVMDTGVRYQLWHALALVAVFLLADKLSGPWLTAAGGLFAFGVLAFSGSLYALALTGAKWFGPITPIGGMALILGWLALMLAAFKETV